MLENKQSFRHNLNASHIHPKMFGRGCNRGDDDNVAKREQRQQFFASLQAGNTRAINFHAGFPLPSQRQSSQRDILALADRIYGSETFQRGQLRWQRCCSELGQLVRKSPVCIWIDVLLWHHAPYFNFPRIKQAGSEVFLMDRPVCN